nr:hypothetical transcript [Hymenolepis microstoma]
MASNKCRIEGNYWNKYRSKLNCLFGESNEISSIFALNYFRLQNFAANYCCTHKTARRVNFEGFCYRCLFVKWRRVGIVFELHCVPALTKKKNI